MGDSLFERPLVSVEKLRHELDRWLDFAAARGGRAMEAIGITPAVHAPAVDLYESPAQVRVVVNLPGVTPDQMEVSIAGNMLTISGQSPDDTPGETDAIVHRQERIKGQFQRSLPMPVPVDHESVCAELRDGVLTVVLNKVEKARKRSIPVTTGSRAAEPSASTTPTTTTPTTTTPTTPTTTEP